MLFMMVAVIATLEAKEKKDPVVMTVAGKDVPLSEFLYTAKKDNSVDFKNKKAVEGYVELFKNFKLKVADAEAMLLHETPRFASELESYSLQLQASYLTDKRGEDSAVLVIYEREKNIPGLKEIYFSYPEERYLVRQVLTKDTLALYLKADTVFQRIKNGESFEEVGESLVNEPNVKYASREYVFPFQLPRELEEKVFDMEPGDISGPVRSRYGFHLFKLDRKIPNPGRIRVAHILSAYPSENPSDEEIEETRLRAEEIYQKAIVSDDFAQLVLEMSDDSVNAKRGGLLEFELETNLLEPIKKEGFALENIGDISKPFQSRYGFHLLKLVDRITEIPFEEKQSNIYERMRPTDGIIDLYHTFVERMKVRHGYVFYPEAYEELERLADEYHPLDSNFINRGMELEKTLVRVDTLDFPQNNFVEYLYYKHTTLHYYSLDFMKDVFDFYVREILTEFEKRSLERDYPEFTMLMQEFYDGTLLFDLANKRVWSKPEEDQARLEAEWLKELNEKYPVKVNWKVIRKIKKL